MRHESEEKTVGPAHSRHEFCTLFDVNYLTRAVVLARSLAESCGPDGFCLRALCMDAASERLVRALELPGVVPISIGELERHDRGLAGAREGRSRVEYAWTALPALCLFALEREPELTMITYLDADLMFYSDPRPLYDEMLGKSIGLTPHRFAPDSMRYLSAAGPYNSGFTTFRNDADALEALRWWRERCLEWCHNQQEQRRWGDQRYLDAFPSRFSGVHIYRHTGGGLAPWNARGHSVDAGPSGPSVDGQPLIYHHYSSLALYDGTERSRQPTLQGGGSEFCEGPAPLVWRVVNNNWPISELELELLWRPYVGRLSEELCTVREIEPGFAAGVLPPVYDFLVVVDAAYLPRALAMYQSLRAVSPSFRLWAYCMDAMAERGLRKLALPSIEIVGIAELEHDDPELAAVRSTRSKAEYCQTAKSAAMAHALSRHDDIGVLTLVDADLYFYADPTLLSQELLGGCILLVPHRRPPARVHKSLEGGEYNTGFVMFRNDPRALDALQWWRERCLEWCHMRVEPGRFTDQRYLHDWPESRPGVKVLRDLGGGVAPWNMQQYDFTHRRGVLQVNGFPLIFVHFQSLRLYRGAAWLPRWGPWGDVLKVTRGSRSVVWTTDPEWDLGDIHYELLWQPYVRRLAQVLDELRVVEPGCDVPIGPPRELLLHLIKLSIRAAVRESIPRRLRRPGYRAYTACRRQLPRLRFLARVVNCARPFSGGGPGASQ